MRKIRILSSVVVAMGMLGVASPWLDGMVAKSHFEAFIANLNKVVQVPLLENQVSLQNYQRGWFQSTATLEFKIGKANQKKVFPFKVEIHHGPLLFKGQYPTIGLSVIKLVPIFSKQQQQALDKLTANSHPTPDYVTTVTLNFLSNASLHFLFPAGSQVYNSGSRPSTVAWKEINFNLEFDEKLSQVTNLTDFQGFEITDGDQHLQLAPFRWAVFMSRIKPEAPLWDVTQLDQLLVHVQLGKMDATNLPTGIKRFTVGPTAYNFEFSPKKAKLSNFLQFGGYDLYQNSSHVKLEPFTFSVDLANSKPENFTWTSLDAFDTAKVQWRTGGFLLTDLPPDIKAAQLGSSYFNLEMARLKPGSFIWPYKLLWQTDSLSFTGQAPKFTGSDFNVKDLKTESTLVQKDDSLMASLGMHYTQLTLPELGRSGPFELATSALAKVVAVEALASALQDRGNEQALNAALTLLAKTGASWSLDKLQLQVPEGVASAQAKLVLPASPDMTATNTPITGPDFFKRLTLDLTASAPVALVKKAVGEGKLLTDAQFAELLQKGLVQQGDKYVAHLRLQKGELRLNDKPLLLQPESAPAQLKP
jgi:uncharacterized protein YdgA (DUF945 family)